MDKLLKKEADKAMQEVEDLIDDPTFKPFFFKALYRIGVDKFFKAATEARKADQPGRKFASLLKYGRSRW